MRYLLVDRIIEWKANEWIKGIKNVSMTEDFLEFHFPKNPVMPGALLLEALTQLGGWLEAVSSDFRDWPLLEKVEKCQYYGFAFPGDRVELYVEARTGANAGSKAYRGTCTVEGKKKVVADFVCALKRLEEIENVDEQRNFFEILSRARPQE